MLNLKEISQRIEQPELCSKQDVTDLHELCVAYPYSQVFPLLYLKALAQNNDVRLDTELEKYACFIADRSILYNLLHPKEVSQSSIIITDVIESNSVEAVTSFKNELLEPNITEKDESTQECLQIEVKNTVIEESKDDIEIIEPKLYKEPQEQNKEELSSQNIPELSDIIESQFESQLLSEAMSSTYSLEKEEEKFSLEQQLKKETTGITISNSSIEITSIEEIEIIKEDNSIDTKKSFSNWLNSNNNTKEPLTDKTETHELINKFITEKPTIKQHEKKLFEGRKENAEFFSPSKKAKQSLDDQQLPVSETLAKIFAAQGNFSKAIYAYQQLMLIIPEKKIFFAVQIEELEKKINK